ncbi:MAG TPA: type VI secretion system tube protein Hcp [Casimicrobiaceae bacterium]|nr:type VI secretion system tube protein Hcp [Casimicrobiaceae bacterium]
MFALALASPAAAAVNAYLFVDGINGPSTSREGAIDLLSFSVGVTNVQSTTTRLGATGQGAGKPVCSDLSIMKVVDSASIPLLADALAGKVLPTVKIVYSKAVADTTFDYFTLTLGNVIVSSVQESGSNENPTESVSFNAQTYTFTYTPQKADGTAGTAITAGGNC